MFMSMLSPLVCRLSLGALLLAATPVAQATGFAFRDAPDGISCKFFDVALGLAWPGQEVPWVDAAGQGGGARTYDVQTVDPSGPRVMRWNVLALVRAWGEGSADNEGLIVAPVGPQGGGADFHSRESGDVGLRPSLRVAHADGSSELLSAAADAHLDCTTYTGLGARPALHIANRSKGVLRFDLTRLRKGAASKARAAELILVRTDAPGWASAGPLGVYRLSTPWTQQFSTAPEGLAAAYRADRGIEQHPAVLFADAMERGRLAAAWNQAQTAHAHVVPSGDEPGLPATRRQSLQVTVPRGENLGLDLRYDFLLQRRQEPEEVYLRYYLRLSPEWLSRPDSGKLPGFGGTYGRAAWGGRGWDGRQGWSARGAFALPQAADHPAHGRLPLASYVYHSESAASYGDIMPWGGSKGAAFLQAERWYCVEQHIKLNTPGKPDGVLRAWVDGKQVFERRDLRLRDTPALRVENIWMNVYLGGTKTAQRDMPLLIDHVVVATRYIGPMPP